MYSKAFTALMVQKMSDPHRADVQSLADEIGVSRATLYRWVSEADSFEDHENEDVQIPTPLQQKPKKVKWNSGDTSLGEMEFGEHIT